MTNYIFLNLDVTSCKEPTLTDWDAVHSSSRLEEDRQQEESLSAELERGRQRTEKVNQELGQVLEELGNARLDSQENRCQMQRKELLEKLRRLYPESVVRDNKKGSLLECNKRQKTESDIQLLESNHPLC